jgi:hypothetical protein
MRTLLEYLNAVSDQGELTVSTYAAEAPVPEKTFEHLGNIIRFVPFISIYFHQAPEDVTTALTYQYGISNDRFKDPTITFNLAQVMGVPQQEWPALKQDLIQFAERIKTWMDKDFNPWLKVQIAIIYEANNPVYVIDFLSHSGPLATEATTDLRAFANSRARLNQFLQNYIRTLRARVGPHAWETISTRDIYPQQTIYQWLLDHPDATAEG